MQLNLRTSSRFFNRRNGRFFSGVVGLPDLEVPVGQGFEALIISFDIEVR